MEIDRSRIIPLEQNSSNQGVEIDRSRIVGNEKVSEDDGSNISPWVKAIPHVPSPWDVVKAAGTPEGARTAMQMVGSAAGGIVGSPVPGGAMVGGAIGYGIGNQIADLVLRDKQLSKSYGDALVKTGKDVGVGLAYELIGYGATIGGKLIGNVTDLVSGISKSGGIKNAVNSMIESISKKQAAKIILKSSTRSPVSVATQIDKNILASEKLESDIPGLKFNLGQKGGDPNLLSMARQAGQAPGVGTSLSTESVMGQNEAIKNHIQNKIRGGGEIDDFINAIKSNQDELSSRTGAAESKLPSQGKGEVDVGRYLRDKANRIKRALKATAKELYDKVPNDLKMNAVPLWDKVDELLREFDYSTQKLSSTPTDIMGRIRKAMDVPEGEIPPKNITMKQVKDFRSQVNAEMTTAISKGEYDLARKLGELKDGANGVLTVAEEMGHGEAVTALETATKFWRDEYIPAVRQGTTNKILSKNRNGEYRVLDSAVGGEYFKPGLGANESAADFYRTFGDDQGAKEMIRDYAAQSLLRESRNPLTFEIDPKRIAIWRKNHSIVLDKFGLNTPVNRLQEAAMEEASFNKSALSKAIGVNPDQAIASVLTSGGGGRHTITRLKDMVKIAKGGGIQAVAGLKAGIGDNLKNQIGITAKDLANKDIDSFAKIDKFMKQLKPALVESGLYSKQELEAFDNVHAALATISKQARPHPQFSGSPTYELLSRLGVSATSIAGGHIGLYGAARGIINILERPIKNQVDEAVARAVFDPVYADMISGLATNIKKTSVQKSEEIFLRRLVSLGAIEASMEETDK